MPGSFEALREAVRREADELVETLTDTSSIITTPPADIVKASRVPWRAELHRRDSHGRFVMMPNLGLHENALAELAPPPQNTLDAEAMQRGFELGYNAKNVAHNLRWARDKLKRELDAGDAKRSHFYPAPNDKLKRGVQDRPGGLEGMIAGGEQHIAENAVEAADNPDAARLRHKLPGVKLSLREDPTVLQEAGREAALKVKPARRRYLLLRGNSMLASMPQDHPQRPYWEGVVDGAKGARQDDRLALAQARAQQRKVFGWPVDFTTQDIRDKVDKILAADERRVKRGLEPRGALGLAKNWSDGVDRLVPGHVERPFGEAVVTELQRRAIFEGPDFEAGRDFFNRALPDGRQQLADAGHLALKRGASLPVKERAFWHGVQEAWGLHVSAPVPTSHEIFNAEHAVELGLESPGERALALADYADSQLKEQVYHGLGVPVHNQVDYQHPRFRLGLELGRQWRKSAANADENIANAQIAARDLARADLDREPKLDEINFWAGVAEGLLGQLDRQFEPPPPDDPSTSRGKAVRHRVDGDQVLEGDVTDVKHLGGGVNTTLRAKIDGQDVIIKPAAGAHGTLRMGIKSEEEPARERAGFILGQKLGVKTPRLIVRYVHLSEDDRGRHLAGRDATDALATVQEMIPDARVAWDAGLEKSVAQFSELQYQQARALTIIDYVLGNTDRHGSNLMIDSRGTIWAIDHGLTLPTESQRLKPYFDWTDLNTRAGGGVNDPGKRIWTAEELDQLNDLLSDATRQDLLAMGVPDEAIVLMRDRVNTMLQLGQFPAPGNAHAYPFQG